MEHSDQVDRTQDAQVPRASSVLELGMLDNLTFVSNNTFEGCLKKVEDNQDSCDQIPEEDMVDQFGQDEILEDDGDGDSVGTMHAPLTVTVCGVAEKETLRTVVEQSTRHVLEVLGAELRGDLQAALREEVSRAVREEFQRCSQRLHELRPESVVVEKGCQADVTTTFVGPLPPKYLETPSCPSVPVMPHPWSHSVTKASRRLKLISQPNFSRPQDEDEMHRKDLTMNSHEYHQVPSGISDSQSSEEQSFMSGSKKSMECRVVELLRQQGLTEYVPTVKASEHSKFDCNSKTRTWRKRNESTSSCTSVLQVSGKAPSVGVTPGEGSAKHRLKRMDVCELGDLERKMAAKLFRERGLLPEHDNKEVLTPSSGSQGKAHEGLHDPIATATSFFSRLSSRSNSTNTVCVPMPPPQAVGLGTEEQMNISKVNNMSNEAASACSIDAAQHASAVADEGDSYHSSFASIRGNIPPACNLEGSSIPGSPEEDSLETAHLDFSHEGSHEEDSDVPAFFAEETETEGKSWLIALAIRISNHLGELVPAACGVVPWDTRRYLWASMLYQWIVLGLVSKASYHSVRTTCKEWEMGESYRAKALALNSVMGMGAMMGLIACGAAWRCRGLVNCCRLLKAYSWKSGISNDWGVSPRDFFCTIFLWCASVLTLTLESQYMETFATTEELLSHIGCFALAAFILLGMSQLAIHMCRSLTKMLDHFCYNFNEQPDFAEVLKDWPLLQALTRATGSNMQLLFLCLQAVVTAVALLCIQEVGRHDTSSLLALAPGLIVALGVFRTFIWAAIVTDKCMIVPMLVNSVSVGGTVNHDRMYAVQYIEHSRAGFYVFELRLTSATVLKTCYVTCVITFYLAAMVFGS